MSNKTQHEYLETLRQTVEYTGDLKKFNRLLFEWVKTGVITRTTHTKAMENLQKTLINYH